MSRIDQAFANTGKSGTALIGYATAGFPDRHTSLRIADSLLQHCDLLELGIPFSDPVLDGPVIQESSRRALEAGFRVKDAFDIAGALRQISDKPLLVMTYYNPVHRMGHESFAQAAAYCGMDGALIPDLPPEEMHGWREAGDAAGLANILFASSTTSGGRLRRLGELTQGFLYCFAVRGTTGMRDSLAAEVIPFIQRARACCEVPLALGLGISSPEQCRQAAEVADGVVVGSALVKAAMDALEEGEDPAERVGGLARELKAALQPSALV
jgi:tryptophan synthase alpha chain